MIKFSATKNLHTAEGSLELDISFTVEKGKLLSIYGNSGAGKTTICRILAGLTPSTKSFIEVDNEIWDDSERKYQLAIQKRSVGFVFQDYALFPHLTVKENIAFAFNNGADKKLVDEVISIMELQQLQQIKPTHLSGGQKQRVALARAIVRKPKILILDEPLAAVDDELRWKLQEYILNVHQQYNLTTLLISHNLPEIFRLADKVLLLEKGKIIKQGSPSEVFSEQKISSKFSVTGEIIKIEKSDIIYIVSVLSANNIIKVVATEKEIYNLCIGKKVIVASKAFNPIIQLIS